ncbi:MAG: preprotein translocase subunit SecG [Candidatus Nomurabacteria bacterium]|nr:MAG: preprotein translocase subunit SecG [Candidatus Nomurabacteria bacterium]
MIFWIKIGIMIVAALMTVAILLQQRGSGMGSAFGADVSVYATKRGLEKILFIATIVLAIVFLALALLLLILN